MKRIITLLIFFTSFVAQAQVDTTTLEKKARYYPSTMRNKVMYNIPANSVTNAFNAITNLAVASYNWGNHAEVGYLTVVPPQTWASILNKPNNLAGYGIADAVPVSRTITINGVAQNLNANRSWTVGDVTSASLSTTLAGYATTSALTTGLAGKENTLASGTVLQYFRGDKTLATFPTIPTNVSQLVNDAGYATTSALTTGLAGKENTIPAGTVSQYLRGDKTWSEFPAIPTNAQYVDLTTAQTVAGAKTFSDNSVFNTRLLVGSSTPTASDLFEVTNGTSRFSRTAYFGDTWANYQAIIGRSLQGGRIGFIRGIDADLATTIGFEGASGNQLFVIDSKNSIKFATQTNLNFQAGNNNRMTIFQNGNVNIGGSTDVGQRFAVVGTGSYSGVQTFGSDIFQVGTGNYYNYNGTNLTDYSRLKIGYLNNVAVIATEKGGTGAGTPIEIIGDTNPGVTIASTGGTTAVNSTSTYIRLHYASSNPTPKMQFVNPNTAAQFIFGFRSGMTAVSGFQAAKSNFTTANQTSTAGYAAEWTNVYEQNTGSGPKLLGRWSTSTAADAGGTVTDRMTISSTGKVTVTDDIEITTIGKGIIIPSPNGQRWRLTPSNSGGSDWTLIP